MGDKKEAHWSSQYCRAPTHQNGEQTLFSEIMKELISGNVLSWSILRKRKRKMQRNPYKNKHFSNELPDT